MHLDALALACVLQELRELTVPARVQQILRPDAHTLALELYAQRQRRYLELHVQGPDSGLALHNRRPRRGAAGATPMLELLRKYARGAGLAELRQPDPVERVATLHLQNRHGPTQLVLELTGRRSNLLLLNPEGRILGLLHPVSGSAARPLRPGGDYVPPPLQGRLSPLDCSAEDMRRQLAVCADMPAVRALTRVLAGVGPTQAREIVFRVASDGDTPATRLDADAAVECLRGLWEPVRTGVWRPSQTRRADGRTVWAPFPLRHLPEAESLSALHPALADRTPADPYHGARSAALSDLRKARTRARRRLDGARRDLPAAGAAEAVRRRANWLLALQHSIGPDQTSLTLPEEGELPPEELPLRGDLTPVQQAQGMYKRARKLEGAARVLPDRIRRLEADLDYLSQLELDLAAAQDRAEIDAVRRQLAESGLQRLPQGRPQPRPARPARGHKVFSSADGFPILVGGNAWQNELVTFRHAGPRDLWLHVQEQPGSHVVIRSGGQAVGPETVTAAAQLAAHYSRRRGEKGVPVTVIARRHVSRLKGGRQGQVRIRQGQARTEIVDAVLPDLREA